MTNNILNIEKIKEHLLKKKKFHIVFLGDSITSAEYVHPNWREIFEYVLKQELEDAMDGDWKTPDWGIRCINSGYQGATTSDLLKKVEEMVFLYRPDLVICLAGKNDMYLGVDVDQHRKNVEALVQKISSKIPNFIYCTSPTSLNTMRNQEFIKYAQEDVLAVSHSGVIFINLFESYKKFDLSKFFTFISGGNDECGIKPGEIDFVHPNMLGQAYIAKVILEEGLGVSFNPELYIENNMKGEMFPRY